MPQYLGPHQIGECQRCGTKQVRAALVEDGYVPGLLVCKDCYDPEHPQDFPALTRIEGVAKLRPAPQQLPMPTPPVLSGSLVAGVAELSWTDSVTYVSLIDTYRIYRASQPVDGEWSEYELVFTFEVEYDDFGAAESVLEYEDTVPDETASYRYYVVGHAIEVGDSDPSNVLDFTPPEYIYLTSKIYPVDVLEAMGVSGDLRNGDAYRGDPEGFEISGDLLAGTLDTILVEYEDAAPEGFEIAGDLIAGEFSGGLVTYDDGEPEGFLIAGDLVGGELDTILIVYTDWPAEGMDISGDLIAGEFT